MKPDVVKLADYHPIDCDCASCEPYHPSRARLRDAIGLTALHVLAGIGIGHVLVWAMNLASPATRATGL